MEQILQRKESINCFLTQTGGLHQGENYQHDEFTGMAVRSVDVYYNTLTTPPGGSTASTDQVENVYGKPFATASVMRRAAGSHWVMPLFVDVDYTDSSLLKHSQIGFPLSKLEVGDVVRFGSTYAGGSTPYCVILEKVPITFLINGQHDLVKTTWSLSELDVAYEYRPGYGTYTDTYSTPYVRNADDMSANKTLQRVNAAASSSANLDTTASEFGSSSTTFKAWDKFVTLRNSDGLCGDDINYRAFGTWAEGDAGNLRLSTLSVKLVSADTFEVSVANAHTLYVGARVFLAIHDISKTYIKEVRGTTGTEGGNAVGGGLVVVIVTGTPFTAFIGSTLSAHFINTSKESACFAYRINRIMDLTSITEHRGADTKSVLTNVTQASVEKGGIQVPGEYRPEGDLETDTSVTKIVDVTKNRAPWTASRTRAKWAYADKFLSIPFFRASGLDLEKCYYPMYRMKDWTVEKQADNHPLRLSFDYDVRAVSKIVLTGYSVFGKRQTDKEDAAQFPDDDYFILKFKEINGNLISNNRHADRAFGVISLGGDNSTPEPVGAQEFSSNLSDEGVLVCHIIPPKKIQTLTLEVLDRDGNPAHFGRIHLWLKLDVLHA